MITFAPYPVPIVIKETKKEAYLLYVESGGQYENDIFACVLCDGGDIIHCFSNQVSVHKNFTLGIKSNE